MKSVYVAHVVTESADHYTWVYAYEPTRKEVIERLYKYEKAEELDWYEQTTSVRISLEDIAYRAS